MSTGLKANSDGSAAIQVGGSDVITLTSGGAATFLTSPTTLAGNLTFTGTGNRILGDFSNATVANRVIFQTSTVNGNTVLGVIPNGTATLSGINFFNGTDTANASTLNLNSSSTAININSTITGTGTLLPMVFQTGGSESMRLSATSKALILAGGDTTANGTGITFPATQSASSNANTLDDYEEGDWTPTFGGSSSDPTGVAYAVQRGKYTKIGNLVNLNFYLAFSTYTGGSGAIYIKGVPFGASGDGDGAIKIENVTLSAGRTYATVTAGSSFIFPQQSGSATTWIAMTIGTAFTSSATIKYFTGSITYMV